MSNRQKMNKEEATKCARNARKQTISELGYLINGLQKDYDRLVKAQVEDDLKGFSWDCPPNGNYGFYLTQHCLRYEQTVKKATEMEQWAMIAEWVEA